MKSVGIIGMGTFGRFMVGHLAPYLRVYAYDRVHSAVPEGAEWANLDEVLKQDIIILAVPVQDLEQLLVDITTRISPESLVVDVSSVKVVPVQLMLKYLPKSCRILATHPLFGPESGANGIAGLTVAVWPARLSNDEYGKIKAFLTDKLEVKVVEVRPDDHDKEMAYVQALTFFVGEALHGVKLPDSSLKTVTYQHMLDIKRVVASHTPELFVTIQKFNPYAKAVRDKFMKDLAKLDEHVSE